MVRHIYTLEAKAISRCGDEILGWVDNEMRAVILSADRDEFRTLISILRHPSHQKISLNSEGAWPMERPMASLIVELGDGDVSVSVDGDTISLAGSSAGFALMAWWVDMFAEDDVDEPGSHAHFDPNDGSGATHLLAAESCPLIIAGPFPDFSS